jgi:hypothetical protein
MATTPFGSDPNSYGARLRAKGICLDAGAAKSERKGKPSSNADYNGWERGVVGEHRPDGTFMPYLTGEGSPVRQKAWAEGRFEKAKVALDHLRASEQPKEATT